MRILIFVTRTMENYNSIELELEIFFLQVKAYTFNNFGNFVTRVKNVDTCQKRGHVSKTFSETRFLLGFSVYGASKELRAGISRHTASHYRAPEQS